MKKTAIAALLVALAALFALTAHAENGQEFATVSYDGNGMSCSIPSQPKYPGQDLTLSSSAPTRRGYVFLGWSRDRNAAEPEFQPKDAFSDDADTVLYAVWMDCADLGTVSESGTFTVSYPIRGRFAYVSFTPGTSGRYVIRSAGSYYKGRTATTLLEYEVTDGSYSRYVSISIDKTGDEFEGVAQLEAGKTYYLFYYHASDPLVFEISDRIDCVSYDGNGMDCSIPLQPKYPGQDITLSSSAPTRRGYVFLGWSRDRNAAEPEFQPKDVFSVDGETVLYAVWMDCTDLGTIPEAGTYTVSYPIQRRFAYLTFTPRYSGQYVIRSTGSYYKGRTATTRLEYEVTDGPYFRWESLSIGKTGDEFEASALLEAGKTYYLFYHHATDPLVLEIGISGYSVSYDGNGMDCSIAPQPKYPGQDLTLSSSAPTRRGYVFLGWSRDRNAAEPEFQPKDAFSDDADTVLYAVWMDCTDLGTVSGNGTFTVSYPISGRFAYVSFTPGSSGLYVIRSTGAYYKGRTATTSLEYKVTDGSYSRWESLSIDKNGDEFEGLAQLEAGKTYYLFYYHASDPLTLRFLYQDGTVPADFRSDIELPGHLSRIEESAFEGSSFAYVEIPQTVTSVASRAFAGCGALRAVLFRGMDTQIEDDAFDSPDVTIIAPDGSAAQEYALAKGFPFVPLD